MGLYINPKNDALFSIATNLVSKPSPVLQLIGSSLIASNIEDIGCYGALAAGGGGAADIQNTELSPSTFIGLSVGSYKSAADAQGPYQEIGGSIGKDGISVGIDIVKNLENETIGATTSIGFTGKPLTFEAHYRVGVTKLYSLHISDVQIDRPMTVTINYHRYMIAYTRKNYDTLKELLRYGCYSNVSAETLEKLKERSRWPMDG